MAEKQKVKPEPVSHEEAKIAFDYPFLTHQPTIDYVHKHGRIMVIIRGPPGTFKKVISEMIKAKYNAAVICSADKYFLDFASPKTRNQNNLRQSHDYCRKCVLTACENNSNLIAVQNSHLMKWEVKEYLQYAAQYRYSIIMAETVRKFTVSPEILVKTTTKTLPLEYFRKRLQKWQECVPLYTGWFLSPADASAVIEKCCHIVSSFQKNEEFLSMFSNFSSDTDDISDLFDWEGTIFSIAAFYALGNAHNKRSHFLSDKVQDVYGKTFSLVIQGFVATKELLLGVTQLSVEMLELLFEENSISEQSRSLQDDITSRLETYEMYDHYVNELKVMPDLACIGAQETVQMVNCSESENFDVSNCSFIVFGRSTESAPSFPVIKNLAEFRHQCFREAVNSESVIEHSKFNISVDDNIAFKTSEDTFVIRPAQKISLGTIFTGLYV